MLKRLALAAALTLAPLSAFAQNATTPTAAIDGFHQALKLGDTAAAISLLARDLVVYEFGVIDPTLEAYAFRHLPLDMDMAAATEWQLQERQVGGDGDSRWVVSTYRVTGFDAAGVALDYTVMESAFVVRTGGAFRIAHLHWSTDNAEFQAQAQSVRNAAPTTGN
ncbi:MAG: nuclear transport factor 2 family protein [Bauldia sp.]|nr:nuclear transport factor 2 family protein [Bauldia sp.]MCW5777772.1 nuclear transport factor 2 family protein [Phycisphaeraceae bacterium]